ncbi:MAG: hypothetical protein ACFFB0_05770 [Promethearchaeota archaeon]
MNKFGFISLFFTIILYFLQFIPLGFYFQFETPFISALVKVPIHIFAYENDEIFFWGIKMDGNFQFWFNINLLTSIFLIILTPLAALLNIFGFSRENIAGKKLMNANFVILLIISLYIIIGIPIYSKEIFGIQFGYLDIFFYLNNGFFILLINVIIAGIAYFTHPIK